MEAIPKELVIIEMKKEKDGSFKPVQKMIDCTEANMPVAATFEARKDCLGVEIILVNAREYFDQATEQWSHVPDSRLAVKFKGGKFRTQNAFVCEKLMNSSYWNQTKIFPDPEDSTGFWRAAGIIEVVMAPVVKEIKVGQPKFDDIKNIKVDPVLDEDGNPLPVEPIRR
jgi:hypothetical protein